MKPEKQLYQWDVNQYLTGINPAAQYVDYTIGNEVIRLETDGTRCRIPDEVLQTYGGKTCYERYPDGTYRAYSFSVLYAPKPPDYVYTPEERTTFEALTDRVDSAIEEINRRADSGEFTPKKGVDYFTNAEKVEMMESVSTGAVGEFRNVVDSATTEYNDNHNSKLAEYNANASEKLTTYDTNAEQHTTDYNRNAEVKLEAYNQNHAAKVAEYNQNAETKTAEFDSNAAALQTEVDRLRGECDTLAAEKANVDGYYEEMTVGDAEQLVATQFVEDNKPYLFRPTGGSSDVGNRAYLDKIVGGTVVWNQLVKNGNFADKSWWNVTDVSYSVNNNVATMRATAMYGGLRKTFFDATVNNHVYFATMSVKTSASANDLRFRLNGGYKDIYNVASDNWQTLQGLYKYANADNRSLQVQDLRTSDWDDVLIKDTMCIDLTKVFGSTIADYIYSLEQSQAGAGVAWFKKLFPKDYYAYNAGELLSVGGLQSHDTVGFNQWDEEWEVGSYDSDGLPIASTDKIRTKNKISVQPSTAYYFKNGGSGNLLIFWYDDNDTVISYEGTDDSVKTSPANAKYLRFRTNKYGTTYNHDICINLSDPSRNGEYEPYEKHSYPLDSSLTLRGIPKLDASKNLYYDGDEYTSDGKVNRKYGVYTIQASNVSLNNNVYTNISYAEIVNFPNMLKSLDKQCVHSKFGVGKRGYPFDDAGLVGKLLINSSVNGFWFGFAKGTTEEQIKSALDGTTIVYELATPTTETAEPFQNIQVVDDFGTEEFVSTGIVPIGHKTRYPANLRDKLQHLPDLAGMDGTYLIQQSGKQMSLIHMPAVFPETPTEDGTYTLKTVVTGGVSTLQWVVE